MSVNSVAGSFFSQPQFVNPTTRKASEAQEVRDFNAERSVQAKDEQPKPLRTLTPEEEEELKRTLANNAAGQFDSILQQDAQRKAEQRQAEGLSPNGVLLNIKA